MTEETQEPFFTHPEPLVKFRMKDIATAISRGGVPYPTAQARVANYAKAGQVHVRARLSEGKNSPNLYGITDVAAAMMLSSLQDCGVADQEVLSLASDTLYHWYVGQEARSVHPILSALTDTLNNDAWALQLRFMRHSQTQARYILRSFGSLAGKPFWQGAEHTQAPGWIPVGDILINSAPLQALSRLIETPAGAN